MQSSRALVLNSKWRGAARRRLPLRPAMVNARSATAARCPGDDKQVEAPPLPCVDQREQLPVLMVKPPRRTRAGHRCASGAEPPHGTAC
jgi:hypothetical protein